MHLSCAATSESNDGVSSCVKGIFIFYAKPYQKLRFFYYLSDIWTFYIDKKIKETDLSGFFISSFDKPAET